MTLDEGSAAAGAGPAADAGSGPQLAWDAPLTTLRGIGEATASRLAAQGLESVADLCGLFPKRHRELRDLDTLDPACLGLDVRLRGAVERVTQGFLPGRRVLTTARIRISSGEKVEVPFFNQPWVKKRLEALGEVWFEGRLDRKGKKFRLLNSRIVTDEGVARGEVRLVYPAVDGLSELRLQSLVLSVLDRVPRELPDRFRLPDALRRSPELLALELPTDGADALRAMHRPASVAEHERARLAFAVLEAVEIFRRVDRVRRHRESLSAPVVASDETHDETSREARGFDFTDDQRRAAATIAERLRGPHPAGLLLQGDVGTGKTAVALDAILRVLASGRQAAFLAPTELLCTQHARAFERAIGRLGFGVVQLTGSMSAPERREVEARLRAGESLLVCGTHALFSDRTVYGPLGLVVVDEQHRFGVGQRARLYGKGANPHVLVMTATPIPRTLAWTLFGDLEVLTIRQRPQGRPPARALHFERKDWPRVLDLIRRHVDRDGRVYVVCPSIGEEGEAGGVVRVGRELQKLFPTGIVHGRVPAEERESVLSAFRRGALPVLCGTTVLEVGVDVPEATLIAVLRADRFGLSTLHQLRGRVGRGSRSGLCVLVGEDSERIRAMLASRDGFELAEEDLRLRGAGEMLGVRQSGDFDFRSLDLFEDRELLKAAREVVRDEADHG